MSASRARFRDWVRSTAFFISTLSLFCLPLSLSHSSEASFLRVVLLQTLRERVQASGYLQLETIRPFGSSSPASDSAVNSGVRALLIHQARTPFVEHVTESKGTMIKQHDASLAFNDEIRSLAKDVLPVRCGFHAGDLSFRPCAIMVQSRKCLETLLGFAFDKEGRKFLGIW